jgi:hypothetical protein
MVGLEMLGLALLGLVQLGHALYHWLGHHSTLQQAPAPFPASKNHRTRLDLALRWECRLEVQPRQNQLVVPLLGVDPHLDRPSSQMVRGVALVLKLVLVVVTVAVPMPQCGYWKTLRHPPSTLLWVEVSDLTP